MVQMYVDDDCRLRTRRAEREDKRDRARRAAALAVRAATCSGTLLGGAEPGRQRREPPTSTRAAIAGRSSD